MEKITRRFLTIAISISIAILSNASHSLAKSLVSLDLESMAKMENATQYAGVYFLPNLKDSEMGFNSKTITTDNSNRNEGEQCKGYNYSRSGSVKGTTACSAPQSPFIPCSFNPQRFADCHCDTRNYSKNKNNCVYVNTSSPAPDQLVGGKACFDGSFLNGTTCGCTTSAFPYTTDSSCGDSKKIINPTSYCYTISDTTRRYDGCKCRPEYNLDATKSADDGWTCDSCDTDVGGRVLSKFQCTATACPMGTSTNPSCSTNETPSDTEYKSGGVMCKKCQANTNCSYFWNADGGRTIPTGKCSWRGLGANASITTPAGPFTSVWVQFWQNTSVSGEFTTNELRLGAVSSSFGSEYTSPRTHTFNDKVTINGKLLVDGVTTYNFKGGICGDFTCYRTNNKGTVTGSFTCPAKSDNCKFTCDQNNYFNANGTRTIPTDWCHISGYGSDNITIIQGSQQRFANVNWTFDKAFIKGGKIVADSLVLGIHGGQMQTNALFENPVEVNGDIFLIANSTVAFPGGISGDYNCIRQIGNNKTAISCPFKCTQNNYFNGNGADYPSASQCSINGYGSSNTTYIPSGGMHVQMAQWSFSSATVNGGPLYIYGDLVLGAHGGGTTANVTFNVPVYMSGRIRLMQNSTIRFNKGITGAYKCYRNNSGSDIEISCPF